MKTKEHYSILRYIIPQYDEITLFAMSFSCGMLLIAGAFTTKWEMKEHLYTVDDFKILMIILFFLSGLLLSLYHAFTDRPKTYVEKYLMLFFAVILNGFSGIFAGTYFLVETKGWLVVFPILNIINGAVLLLMFRSGELNENNISDQNVSHGQVVLAGATVVIVFAICHYLFDLIWVQTLSICVAYATNLSRGAEALFMLLMPKSQRGIRLKRINPADS